MNLFERLSEAFARPVTPSDAARQLGAVARRNHRCDVMDNVRAMRVHLNLDTQPKGSENGR